MLFIPLLYVVLSPVLGFDFLNVYNSTSITIDDLRQLRNSQLQKLNSYRAIHGVSPVFINQSLNSVAQDYSAYLYKNDKFNHSTAAFAGEYGQNLFRRGSLPYLTYNYGDATKMWYDEVQYYNYDSGSSIDPGDPTKEVNHFTAQIWKSITSVGFGFAAGPRERQHNGELLNIVELYVVANYYPTPNVIGLFRQNVPRPI